MKQNINQAIFTSYTGSAMLNNAIYTVEAAANVSNVESITPNILLGLLKTLRLQETNKRLKSYTMLFTNNGTLFQPPEKKEEIYITLLHNIINGFENQGVHECEISGLRFEKSFSSFYKETLKSLGCDPEKSDTTINRVWWPLIGSLGSDAQALPQARYAFRIHPICIVFLQFLPLATYLYKGRALLVDSINHAFAREFIKNNYSEIRKRISSSKVGEPIDNESHSKGEYLFTALSDLENYLLDYEQITDFNLWSYTNSGTGASCEIDRVPGPLIRKLRVLYANNITRNELKNILLDKVKAGSFLQCLESNLDWWGLYPTKKFEGVSIDFFNLYQNLIGNLDKLSLLSYIAGLLEKYLTDKEKKDIAKSDSFHDENYSIYIFKTLLLAAEHGDWDIMNHLHLLDNSDEFPVKNKFFPNAAKIIHYYYQKKYFEPKPELLPVSNQVTTLLAGIIQLINHQVNSATIWSNLNRPDPWKHVSINSLLCREEHTFSLSDIYHFLYDHNGFRKDRDLYQLLRLYSLSKVKTVPPIIDWPKYEYSFLNKYENFAEAYLQDFIKRKGSLKNFQKSVLDDFPSPGITFFRWIMEIWQRLYVKEKSFSMTLEDLLCNDNGKEDLYLSQFAIRFYLHKKSNLKKNIMNERSTT